MDGPDPGRRPVCFKGSKNTPQRIPALASRVCIDSLSGHWLNRQRDVSGTRSSMARGQPLSPIPHAPG